MGPPAPSGGSALEGMRMRRTFVIAPVAALLVIAGLYWLMLHGYLELTAYLLVAGRGVLAGWSAAELLGAGCAPLDCPAEVIITAGELRSHPGLLVHRGRLGSGEIRCVGEVVCTPALRTAYDLARWRDLTDAVFEES